MVYSTLIGGSGMDVAHSLALTFDNRAVVVGGTTSADFPVTPNAVQGSFASAGSTNRDAVIVRLDAGGAVDYASYLGGPGDDCATGVAVDSTGDIYVTGLAGSQFPTLANAFAPSAEYGAFVTRLDHASGQLVYSTYIPGVSVDNFLTTPQVAIQVDDLQNAYLAGPAEFVFPTTAGAFQTDVENGARSAFVLELNPSGTDLVFSTLIGGSSDDFAQSLALTGDTVTIAGLTNSYDFPVTDHSMEVCNVISIPTDSGIPLTTFVASFDHNGRLITASEYGTCDHFELVTATTTGSQEVLVAGTTGENQNSYVNWIDFSAANPVQVSVILDAASLQVGAYCPLELISIFGQGLGPKQGAAAVPSGGFFATSLAGTTVSLGSFLLPILYVSDNQINAVVRPALFPQRWHL